MPITVASGVNPGVIGAAAFGGSQASERQKLKLAYLQWLEEQRKQGGVTQETQGSSGLLIPGRGQRQKTLNQNPWGKVFSDAYRGVTNAAFGGAPEAVPVPGAQNRNWLAKNAKKYGLDPVVISNMSQKQVDELLSKTTESDVKHTRESQEIADRDERAKKLQEGSQTFQKAQADALAGKQVQAADLADLRGVNNVLIKEQQEQDTFVWKITKQQEMEHGRITAAKAALEQNPDFGKVGEDTPERVAARQALDAQLLGLEKPMKQIRKFLPGRAPNDTYIEHGFVFRVGENGIGEKIGEAPKPDQIGPTYNERVKDWKKSWEAAVKESMREEDETTPDVKDATGKVIEEGKVLNKAGTIDFEKAKAIFDAYQQVPEIPGESARKAAGEGATQPPPGTSPPVTQPPSTATPPTIPPGGINVPDNTEMSSLMARAKIGDKTLSNEEKEKIRLFLEGK